MKTFIDYRPETRPNPFPLDYDPFAAADEALTPAVQAIQDYLGIEHLRSSKLGWDHAVVEAVDNPIRVEFNLVFRAGKWRLAGIYAIPVWADLLGKAIEAS